MLSTRSGPSCDAVGTVAALPLDAWIPTAEPLLRFVLVVGSTSELNVVDCGRAPVSKRDDVVKLEKAALGASARLPTKAH
jgi:hypothetical protein